MPVDPLPSAAPPLASPGPSASRTLALRWLVRLRNILWVMALIAIAVYFAGGMRPGVRLAVFVAYGAVALAYVGVYLYAVLTRRQDS